MMIVKFKNKEHSILWGLVAYSLILGALTIVMLDFLNITIKEADSLFVLPFWMISIPLFFFLAMLYLMIFSCRIVKENYSHLKGKLTVKSKK
jgi:hypothetical protein